MPAPSVWHERKPLDVTPRHDHSAPDPPPDDNVADADLDASSPGVQAHACEHNGDQRTPHSPCQRNVRVECSPRSGQEDESREHRDCEERSARSEQS